MLVQLDHNIEHSSSEISNTLNHVDRFLQRFYIRSGIEKQCFSAFSWADFGDLPIFCLCSGSSVYGKMSCDPMAIGVMTKTKFWIQKEALFQLKTFNVTQAYE